MTPLWQTLLSASHLPAAREIGYALMHSLWQGAIVAAVLSLALTALRKRSASARYVACCIAMVAMLAWPAATASLRFLHAPPPPSDAAIAFAPIATAPDSSAPIPSIDLHSTAARGSTVPDLLPFMSWFWLAGVVLLSTWNVTGYLRVRRLGRTASSAPNHLQMTLQLLARRINLARNIAIRLCDHVAAPAVIGVLRPIVLVPASALTELSPDHLEALLLHELAHVKRHDYLVNLLQTAAETLLFYHPAAWWISAQIRREREHCCDDLAARYCGSATLYARALAAMEEVRGALVPHFALAALGNGKLLRRIERLVASHRQQPQNTASPVLAGAGVLVLLAATTLILAHPSNLHAQAKATSPPPPTTSANTILPEDLQPPKPTDYKISPNDMLQITLADLNGPRTETIKQARVTETGNTSLPFLKEPVHAQGLTEIQLEQAIIKAYRDANLIQNANVSVTIVEARGRSFNIVGAVNSPGIYPILDSNFRLLNAIAMAHGTLPSAQITSIHVLRPDNGELPQMSKDGKVASFNNGARIIEIPASKVLEGDERSNIVIRPGDTIVVNRAPATQHVVRLVVGADSIRFQGEATTWEKLARLLGNLPDPEETVLEISPESADLPVGKYLDAQSRAQGMVAKYGVKSLTQGPAEGRND